MPKAQIKDEKTYRKLRGQGESKEKAARIANATAASSPSKVGQEDFHRTRACRPVEMCVYIPGK